MVEVAQDDGLVAQASQDHILRLNRIARVSRIMKWVLTGFITLVVLVGILLLLVLTIPDILQMSDEVMELGDSTRSFGDVPALQRWALAFFYELCITAFIATLWYMRRVFASFQVGDYFASRTLSSMIWCGIWFVLFGFSDFLEEPVSSTLTTMDLGEDMREFRIIIEGSETFFVIFGIMFITIGWVMREAARLHEENQQFI